MEEKTETERCASVSVLLAGEDEAAHEASLGELERLIETAGGECVFRMTQQRPNPDIRTCIGSGKVKELSDLCRENGVTLVVFDTELSPSQIRNLEDEMDDGVRVIDRSMLILDIFALHAKTGEGKLQVELAQLKYTVPRLYGKGLSLSRQGGSGSIASRGPGETKLETDRRHVKRRVQALEEELSALADRRLTQRKQRDKSGIYKIAIAGYTNAGKSTLLNRLTDAGILAEDKLFATLDPTTRKFRLPCGDEVLLIDTVGFIRNLPTHLIRAFRSTLDEVAFADAVLVLIDASDPENASQLEVTEQLLKELGCEGKPILYAYNKCDREAEILPQIPAHIPEENRFFLSAKTGEGIDVLVCRMEALAKEGTSRVTFRLPSDGQATLAKMHRFAVVEQVEYREDGIHVTAVCDGKAKGMFREWSL